MHFISSIFGRLRTWALPAVFHLNSAQVFNCILEVFSAKQTIRPDSAIACYRRVVPYLKQMFAQECWKVSFVSKRFLHLNDEVSLSNDVTAIEALKQVEKAIEHKQEGEIVLNTQERRFIQDFLTRAITLADTEYFKLNAYLNFVGKAELWKTLKACRELFQPLTGDCVVSLQEKMNKIKCLKESSDIPFRDEDKLTARDIRLLLVASNRRKTLELLHLFQIQCPYYQMLCQRWSALEQLYASETSQYLRELCLAGYKSGRVFFYDWCFKEIRDFIPLDNVGELVKHIFYSRVAHATIIVKKSENQTCLSHVNSATGTHAFHPVPHPIMGALGYFVELDISSLLPQNVTADHKMTLQRHFLEGFVRFASEDIPKVHLNWKALLTFFCGRKSLFPQPLSKVGFTPSQSQLCSGYVGVIFLKAIQQVNLELSRLGYQEQIAHPFGEHEILDRMDILRLLYHWKRLNVMKVVPIDTFIAKVFAAPKL